MAATPEEMTATMIRNLKEKTGRPLTDWLQVVRECGKAKHGEIVKHLKTEHGLTHGYANLIAHRALQAAPGDNADEMGLIEAQYGGAKAALRPVFDALIKAVGDFGADVVISPKKTYVSLRRNKQFALLQPSTATRLDVGINLKGIAPTERLEASGSFNAMVSHRVRVASKADVNKELVAWLRQAYEAS